MYQRLAGEDEDHSDIAKCFVRLGSIAGEKGALDEEGKWYLESFEMFHRVYGDAEPYAWLPHSLHLIGVNAREKGFLE